MYVSVLGGRGLDLAGLETVLDGKLNEVLGGYLVEGLEELCAVAPLVGRPLFGGEIFSGDLRVGLANF